MRLSKYLLFLICYSTPSFAEIDFEDAAFPEFITSARALAIGNAYLNRVDDSWSAFYNPAGLGSKRRLTFHVLNFHAESNSGLISTVGQGDASDTVSNINDSFKPEGARQLLLENRGTLLHSRLNFFPNITFRNFSLGFMYSSRTRSTLGEATDAQLEFARRRDMGPVMAFNIPLFGGVIKLGASTVWLNRKEILQEYAADSEITNYESDEVSGSGIVNTLGGRITLPVAGFPTLSGVLRNSGAMKFSETPNDPNKPANIKQTIDVGLSVTPMIGKRSSIHVEVNWKDTKDKYVTETKRRIGAGIEFDILRTLYIRLGYGDGWGSGGIGLRTKRITFDLTTYAVDTTTDEFRGEEDRRFVLSFASGL